MARRLPPSRRVRVVVEADLSLGNYEVRYENVTHPGQQIDFGEIIFFLRKVFAQQSKMVREDADDGATGQAKRKLDDFN